MMPENDDAQLFQELRTVWDLHDPMPDGLVDDILVALATEHLSEEYHELLLVSDERTLAGVRGAAPRILEFGVEAVTLLLRIDSDGEHHRIDGWLAPPRAGRVAVEVDGREVASAPISPEGRFEFPDVASGTCRLVIHPVEHDGYSVTGGFSI